MTAEANKVAMVEDDDNAVYLDANAGPRPLYYRYALSQ